MEEKEIQGLSQRILVNAAQKLGGAEALARYLGVVDATLADWLIGKSVPPAEAILKAVQVLLDSTTPASRDGAAEDRDGSRR